MPAPGAPVLGQHVSLLDRIVAVRGERWRQPRLSGQRLLARVEMASAAGAPSASARALLNRASLSFEVGLGVDARRRGVATELCQSPERLKMATASVGWAPTEQYCARSELTRITDGSFFGW